MIHRRFLLTGVVVLLGACNGQQDNGAAGKSGAGASIGSGGTSGRTTGGSSGSPGGGGTTATGGATTSSGGAATATGGKSSSGSGGVTTSSGGAMTATGGQTTGAGTGGTTGGRDASIGGAGGSTAPAIDGSAGSAGGYPLGNPAVPSAGCGKALSTFKSGTNTTYKISSASLDREYIVYIPSTYDSSKPYRLVFGMHCMGSSATACANNDKYYRLQPLDTGSTTIFVAPQGYTDGSPWRGGDNKDQVFVDDLVKLFESELCIDISRIFSVGFSFGAMFTNALAQTHQDTFRGVVVYATADYNIYFPTNTGKPLAYFGVHGTADGTCPFKSGQASKDWFVKNNKCTVPASVPEATSSTHVCYDYECPTNYPVKWCTHNGGHTDLPTDPGQSKSWDIDMTWKFLTQF